MVPSGDQVKRSRSVREQGIRIVRRVSSSSELLACERRDVTDFGDLLLLGEHEKM